MSIKKLFGKSNQVLPNIDIETISSDVESPENIKQKIEDFETYVPPIDFSTASNYVRFGSAKKYYTKIIHTMVQIPRSRNTETTQTNSRTISLTKSIRSQLVMPSSHQPAGGIFQMQDPL